jgi:hypothetical protein
MTKVQVDVGVHESWVQQITIGLPVVISTDTGQTLDGRIESIASVPDSQSWYRNPDLKVYSTKVTIENKDGKLRPGMNCQAEIIVEEIMNVLSLPVQAVHSNGEFNFCYIRTDEGSKLTKIDIGKHNGQRVVVKSGISEGDDVYLAVPAGAESIPTRARAKPRTRRAPSTTASKKSTPETPGRSGNNAERFKNMTPAEREALRKKYSGNRPGGSGTGRSRGGIR